VRPFSPFPEVIERWEGGKTANRQKRKMPPGRVSPRVEQHNSLYGPKPFKPSRLRRNA
jgi:hypothetical protein